MNINTAPSSLKQGTAGGTPGYMSGFGNSFETEAFFLELVHPFFLFCLIVLIIYFIYLC